MFLLSVLFSSNLIIVMVISTTTESTSLQTAVLVTSTTTKNSTTISSSLGLSNNCIMNPTSYTMLWTIINILISVVIIFGNTLIIIAIRFFHQFLSTISNLFILSLAISDLTVGFTLPYHLAFYLGSDFDKSRVLCLIRFFLIIFACTVSSLTLITIAVDRYIAIVYALHYRRYMTRRTACIIIILNWLTGGIIAIIPMFSNHWEHSFKCELNPILPPWYMVGVITPAFLIIWTIMSLLYWRIMREATKHVKQLRNRLFNTERENKYGSEWKSVRVVFFTMACFSICWFPYFIVACSHIFFIYETTSAAYKIAFLLAMANSGLNPLVYSWKNSRFRNASLQILLCKVCKNNQINLHDYEYAIPPHNGSTNQKPTKNFNLGMIPTSLAITEHQQQQQQNQQINIIFQASIEQSSNKSSIIK